jgi:hypothetical protein
MPTPAKIAALETVCWNPLDGAKLATFPLVRRTAAAE